ncbi:MAG: helix-turn-helix transcriptional regulator [Clostridia bacterium]|nr:helix-turn-helix transcriptional regulator [Clostridia bacterium]
MDQVKIGQFIAGCRKKANLTQMQLAEKLNITDRAVSKWECGKAMPDSSIMLELCGILNITVNDLLCGEVITMENYNKELENNLLDMIKQKEESDKRLLRTEIIMAIACLIPLIGSIVIALSLPLEEWIATVIVLAGMLPLLIAAPFAIRIEQKAGYYACGKCGHRYVPTYKSVFAAAHMHTTRYMRCPKCGKRSWQKKVLSRNSEAE